MQLKKIYIILFIAIVNCGWKLASQEYSAIENVTKNTRLKNHNITCITQDSQGFLWVGTNLGLYRYDGYHFIAHHVNSTPPILDNSIRTLLFKDNELWIGSKGGINVMNTLDNTLMSFIHSTKDEKSIADNYVSKIIQDENGVVWVIYNSAKLSRYIGNGEFQNFKLEESSNNYKVNDIFEIENEQFVLELINLKNQSTKIIQVKIKGEDILINDLYKAEEDRVMLFKSDNNIFITEDNEILKLDLQSQQFKETGKTIDGADNSHGRSLTTESQMVYFGTNKSSFYCLELNEHFSFNKTMLGNERVYVNHFFVDKTGLLWIASTNGLYKLKKQNFLFKRFLTKKGFDKNKMRSIIQDDEGVIFALNQRDIFKYDSIHKVFKNLNWQDQIGSSPYAVINYSDKELIIGTQGSGVAIYNKETNILKPFFELENRLQSNTHVLKLFKDTHGILWMGTSEGLSYYDKNKDELVESIDFDGDFFKNQLVYEIKPFKENQLLIGTSKGLKLLRIDYSKSPIRVHVTEFENLSFEIRSVLVGFDVLWIATQSNGLVKYNLKNNSTSIIGESQGLSNNTTYSILPGIENELWIGTLNGLSRYDTIQKQFLNFYDYDGLADNEFNSSSNLITADTTYYLGGQNGLSSFHPKGFITNNTNFNLNITDINWYDSENDSTYNVKINNNDLGLIKLPYSNAFVNFEFSLTDFFRPEKNTFKYKFMGLHNDWRVLNKTNVLTLTNLPPGEYILEVMASTNYGKWNTQQLSIPIEVSQIYYKRWWFLTSLGVLLVLFILFVRKYELYHIKKLEKLRLRISRDLHDELGSVLTGIAIRSELINENIDDNKKDEFLKEMGVQSRGAVDTLSDLVWAIDSRNNGLQNLSDRMHNVLFQLLQPRNISFTFKDVKSKNPIELNQEHRQHVFLIFKEAITNIIKHSNATHVDVSISKSQYNLKLIVHDNGSNFGENVDNLNGNGLKNMKTRAEKINGKLKFVQDKGFKVELIFDYLY